ncbi:TSUP family transporter [Polynucleobacter kasalickyi]|uniref:Probable membrane transporter protein n=1 Tax=Polynucleobacter kasalickyi TaxID=1938817 RepID=A0A1W2BS47_9BURK|nr:TSUP family transporter [Polynucleobacter kasalickyi]SMC75815.1 hypothetical protein SAMN06296008_11537 [Polynucleobacter kasalickyi]
MSFSEFFDASIFFLGALAFIAGFIDSIVGGGGLIQVPALFVAFPGETPATLFGTNKLASLGGTAVAAKKFLSSVQLPRQVFLLGGLFALLGSFFGAWAVTQTPANFLRQCLPFLLVALLIFTLINKNMGMVHQPFTNTKQKFSLLVFGTGLIGFYDGFFGPGTGMFLMFLFVQFLGFDFINGAAATKVINCITNFAALALFIPTGHINWTIALWMMFFNILGSFSGSRLAIAKGSTLVRKVFILVVILLILKTSNDSYHWLQLITI